MGKLFGTDGVRGKANQHPITPEIALQLGKAVAKVLTGSGPGPQRAVIGKDTRLSGYMLETALTSGLVSMGMEVYLLGVMPTPAVAHLTRSMGAAAGLMITASHNPADDNGIKVFNNEGFKLDDALEAEIEALILGGTIAGNHIRPDQIGKAYRLEDARGRYLEFAKGSVGSLNLSGMRIVLDCANGAAYHIAPLILRELGAEVIKLGIEPDGININAGVGAMHTQTLRQKVLETRADLGVALDGDADRAVFCDASGEVVNGDRIIGLAALALKERGQLRQDTVVVTSMSNLGLLAAMKAAGIKVETTAVGDRYVIERLRQDGLNFGGEESGHLIFRDFATTGDGIVSALQILKIMKAQGRSLGELSRHIEIYPSKLLNLPVKEKRPLDSLPKLQQVLAACDQAFDGTGGRHLVRYSGTENKIRLLVEARSSQDVQLWLDRISQAVKEELC